MTSQPANNLLERKILFFRADIGFDDGGIPLDFDPQPALTAINALPFTNDDGGRYEAEVDGNALCLIVHQGGSMPSVRFCRVRRIGLPQLEQAGQITDIDQFPYKWVAVGKTGVLAVADSMEEVFAEVETEGMSGSEFEVEFLDSNPADPIL